MKVLEYPLFAEGYINRYLTTGVCTQEQQFAKAALSGRVNEWLKKGFAIHENPCRKEFVDRIRADVPDYLDMSEILNGDKVSVFGEQQPVSLYFPFGNTGVDASGFYYCPTWLRMYSYTMLWAEKAETVEFELETCGGARIWLNGQLVADFTPFTRNMVKKTAFSMPLLAGDNQLLVCLDDLAERDTDYYFRLKCLGDAHLCIHIPVAETVAETEVRQLEGMLERAAFDQEAFFSEPVLLQITPPAGRKLDLGVQVIPGEFIEKMEHGEDLIRYYHYHMNGNETQMELFDAADTEPGFYYFVPEVVCQGIRIRRKLGCQLVRKEFLGKREDDIADRKRQALEVVVEFAPENTYKAAALFQLEREYQRAERIIRAELPGVWKRKDCSDFHFIMMLHIYKQFHDRISEGLKDALEDAMLNYRYWIDEPGDDVMWFFSENHALLFHCLQYLAGSFLPDQLFVNSGRRGREVQARGEELLHEWFDEFFQEFITEWNSNAYIPVDVLGLGTLYNLTEEGDSLHEKAGRALDMIFYSLAVNAHKGAVMTSFGRSYEKEMKGNYNAGTTSLLYVAYNDGFLNRACNGYLPLALGGYEAPAEYRQYLRLDEDEELVFQNTQGFEQHVNLYLYKNAYGLLSTAVGFKPFKKGYQEHIMQATLDETAQVFINHPGEAFPYGSGRPNFWAGNGVLPLAVQYRNTAILWYRIPADQRIDYTHAYIPISEFTRYKGDDSTIVLEKDGGYIAVKAWKGLTMQKEGPGRFREFLSCGRENVWVVKVGKAGEYKNMDQIFTDCRDIHIAVTEDQVMVNDGNEYIIDREHLLRVNGAAVYNYPLTVEGVIERTIKNGEEWGKKNSVK